MTDRRIPEKRPPQGGEYGCSSPGCQHSVTFAMVVPVCPVHQTRMVPVRAGSPDAES